MANRKLQDGELDNLFDSDGSIEDLMQSIEGEVQIPKTYNEKDYNKLDNRPSINGVTLVGDKSFEDIGLHFMTNVELKKLLGGE